MEENKNLELENVQNQEEKVGYRLPIDLHHTYP